MLAVLRAGEDSAGCLESFDTIERLQRGMLPVNPQAKRFYVSGVVQGVGYRFYAQRVAHRLGLAGYVRNRHDGSVEAYVIGSPAKLEAFRAELERGPSHSVVTTVVEEDAELDERYGGSFVIEH